MSMLQHEGTLSKSLYSLSQVMGLPILLVSRVTEGTAAVSVNGTDVGVAAEAAGIPALPTAILSCMSTLSVAACFTPAH